MKKKIGEIYNKPIVVGDKNLVKNNEIHISQLTIVKGNRSITVKTENYFSGEVVKETVMEIPGDAIYWSDFVIYDLRPETASFYQGINCEDEDDPATCYKIVNFYDGEHESGDLKGPNGTVKLNDPIHFDYAYKIFIS